MKNKMYFAKIYRCSKYKILRTSKNNRRILNSFFFKLYLSHFLKYSYIFCDLLDFAKEDKSLIFTWRSLGELRMLLSKKVADLRNSLVHQMIWDVCAFHFGIKKNFSKGLYIILLMYCSKIRIFSVKRTLLEHFFEFF